MGNILKPNGRILEPLLPIKEGMANSSLPTSKAIVEGIDNLITQGKKPAVSIEIISGSDLHIEEVKNWIGFSVEDIEPNVNFIKSPSGDRFLACRYKILNDEQVKSSEVGSDYTDIKVIDFDYVVNTFGKDGFESQMYFYASDPCAMFLFSKEKKEIPNELIVQLKSLCHKLEFIQNIEVNGFVSSQVDNIDFERWINALYNFGLSKSAESVQKLLELTLEQEKRSLKGKKVMNNQKVIELKNTKEGNERELNNDLRKYISTYSKSILKGVEEGVDKKVNSRNSSIQEIAKKYGDNFSSFEEVKGAKETALRIPESLKMEFLNDLRNNLLGVGQENLMVINDSLKELKQNVEDKINESGLSFSSLNIRYLSDIKLKEIIKESVHWDRDFEGTLPKKGAYEYFMAARKFQMILFMVASSFGLSFMGNLKLYMIPLTVVLLGFGGISIHRSVQKERKEKIKKEKKKVLDLFKSETKKVASDFTRTWMKYLKDGLDNAEQSSLTVVDEFLRVSSENQKRKMDEDRAKVQGQIQNLEDTDRRQQNMERSIENIKRSISRLQDDFERDLK